VVRLPLFKEISPNQLTIISLCFGFAILLFSWVSLPFLAFLSLLLSGYFDTLDGSLAREKEEASPAGAALDIFCDRAVESLIILSLFLQNPQERGLLCILISCSILLCVTSFLVVGIFSEKNGEKSFHYSPGLMERTEAFIFFGLMLLFPSSFFFLAILFSLLTLATGIFRLYQFNLFSDPK
jgi:archaetidylinositol phosphate synthase